jgi:hypothetical protein
MKRKLENVTLLGIDCVNVERLQKALDISCDRIDFGEVKLLTSLETNDMRKVSIPHIDSIEDFSKFCLLDLCNYVDTEYVLLVQHDGFILNPDSWEDDFLKYDYIGAPWIVNDWSVGMGFFKPEQMGENIVGNGGFCIRNKRFLNATSRLVKDGSIKEYHPEDIAVCSWYKDLLEKEGLAFAPADLGHRFSIEGRDEVYDKQFGFHGFRWTDITKWIDENPQWGIVNRFEPKK